MSSFQTDTRVLYSSDGTIIYAEATGSPHCPHLVLLAGLSLSGCIYDDLCLDRQLLEKLYIVRYDVRGHGRSGKPTTEEAYQSKRFADDFKTVIDAFKLERPVLAAWSMGAAVATDVAAHLPPATLSGVVYLAGVPCTGDLLGELVAPELAAALPGLLAKDDVVSFQTSAAIFTEKLFAQPNTVPYKVKALYLGHSLTPEIMALSLNRPMDIQPLREAGKDGLPLLIIQGTADGHRVGGPKTVEEVMKPHFENFECVWLEGRGHALHYECPGDIVRLLIEFTDRFGGKDYRTA
ncbi:alpha/beta-hydrolase [Mycena albidolilacea]|uniref:Alpha/beta-hydrolase n=1 Tax=Mycena albidolilacea TaxID=1033008 RepID=A0AAD7EZH0_9AGAR|nr:alpha/beta-hydrolase [Mycena albidolilacea]